jgi:hypothetical protein
VHYTTSCNTQSSAPEDGWDQRPKHVYLIGIIYKPLLLHPVGVYITYINDARSSKYQISNSGIYENRNLNSAHQDLTTVPYFKPNGPRRPTPCLQDTF